MQLNFHLVLIFISRKIPSKHLQLNSKIINLRQNENWFCTKFKWSLSKILWRKLLKKIIRVYFWWRRWCKKLFPKCFSCNPLFFLSLLSKSNWLKCVQLNSLSTYKNSSSVQVWAIDIRLSNSTHCIIL